MNFAKFLVFILVVCSCRNPKESGQSNEKIENNPKVLLVNDTSCLLEIDSTNTFSMSRFCNIRYSDSTTETLEAELGSGALKKKHNLLYYDSEMPLRLTTLKDNTYIIEVHYLAFKGLISSGSIVRRNGDTVYLRLRSLNADQFSDKEMDEHEESFFNAVYEIHKFDSDKHKYIFMLEVEPH